MQIAGNTLEERAANEVKYYSQVAGQDPYDLNIARMDSTEDYLRHSILSALLRASTGPEATRC